LLNIKFVLTDGNITAAIVQMQELRGDNIGRGGGLCAKPARGRLAGVSCLLWFFGIIL